MVLNIKTGFLYSVICPVTHSQLYLLLWFVTGCSLYCSTLVWRALWPGVQKMGILGIKIYRTNCLLSDSLGLGDTRNLYYFSIVGQLFRQMFRQCCVQQSNGWKVLCPIVKMWDNALSNCPMVGQWCFQQSNVAKFHAFRRTVWD